MDLYKYGYLYEEESVHKGILIEYDGGIITNSELYSEQFELHESLYSDSYIRFGACESNYVKFRVSQDVGSLKGKRITVKYILEGDSEKCFQVGVYTVQSDTPSGNGFYRDIIAYDDMYKIIHTDVKKFIKEKITFPTTLPQIRMAILDSLGIEYDDTELSCDGYVVYGIKDGADKITAQTAIEATLELGCAFGNIDRFGVFSIVRFQPITFGEVYPGDDTFPSYTLIPSMENVVYLDGWHNQYDSKDGKIYFDIWDKYLFDGEEYFTNYNSKHRMYIEFEDFDESYRLCCMMDKNNYVEKGVYKYYPLVFHYIKDGVICSIGLMVNSYVDRGETIELVSSPLYVYADENYDSLWKITGLPCFYDEESMEMYLKYGYVFGCINWNGTYEYKKSLCIDCEYDDYYIPDIERTSMQTNNDAFGRVPIGSSGAKYNIISDLFLFENDETLIMQTYITIMDDFLKNVNTFGGAVPVKATIRGNPCMRLGDSVRVNARLGTFDTYIATRTLSGIQSLKDAIEFKAQEEFNEEIL